MVTAAGPDRAIRIRVRRLVVSTNSTRGDRRVPAASVSGDQLCIAPRARTRYPCRHAQLTTSTTCAGVAGVHVHTASTSIACAQFSKRS